MLCFLKKIGDKVNKGDVIARINVIMKKTKEAETMIKDAYTFVELMKNKIYKGNSWLIVNNEFVGIINTKRGFALVCELKRRVTTQETGC